MRFDLEQSKLQAQYGLTDSTHFVKVAAAVAAARPTPSRYAIQRAAWIRVSGLPRTREGIMISRAVELEAVHCN